MNKRDFIKSAAAMAGATAVAPLAAISPAKPTPASSGLSSALADDKAEKKVVLKKGLGFGMIKEELSLTDKFKLAVDLGFDGVELNSPVDFSMSEIINAKAKSGIELPSVVNKDHWSSPLSDPNPEVRKKCIESVAKSLREVKELGGDTVLVVPGVVNEKVPYEQAYITSQNSIRELIPYAEETGMQIALENVWNNFLLSPVEAKRYVDEINHPLVGWYFDIGNVLRYGWPEHWIRTLNRRIMKLHIKEFSRELMNSKGLWEGFKVDLLKGDNNWPVVMKAVSEISYQGGWLTAEVSGGDRNHLKQISTQMDKIISFLGYVINSK
ncbi:MAG: Xylose isomerase domain-containing protein TIM barrel [Proteiniphilum acetatigenes]|uniref:Xylose isomerase domain-containing protein TIM barrel n=1 Tax=Proteiniphilum acetatigenes TaxID=294710 RepID=A0A101HKD9_9BACT|nr:MAG: Xylose isomerase domain-containing protein TIM barrel [Proteiniphilum acetatigenes]